MRSINDFQGAMLSAGLGSIQVIPDGEIHRFHVEGDKCGSQNGWYVCFGEAGAFGSWKVGISETWRTDKRPLSRSERSNMTRKIEAERISRILEQKQQHQRAAQAALEKWSLGVEPLEHPYLDNKNILAIGIRQKDAFLMIPVKDIDDSLWSLQIIDGKGNKRFLKGGRTKGCFHLIAGPIEDRVLICEGYATAVSLLQYHKYPVVAAFSAQNLLPVAEAIALRHPQAEITIAADNDRKTQGNPGLRAGHEAAIRVGGKLIYPIFEDGETGSDFNDWYNWEARYDY